MKSVTVGNVTYKIVNGKAYREATPDSVISTLERAHRMDERIRVFYGDAESGLDWMEENDIIGTVGYSTGDVSIPLLIRTSRSYGGGSILDSAIVRITIDKQDIYRHPFYHLPSYKIQPTKDNGYYDGYYYEAIYQDSGNVIARFKTEQSAKRWDAFIQGIRNSL